ncbi:MAG: hypothetical protein AAB965_00440 [Patescibacteria group bacterium]
MKNGFSLVETMIYIAILLSVLILFVNLLIPISNSYITIRMIRKLDSAAVSSMDRMTREIRNASSINIASILGVEPSKLVLDNSDATQSSFPIIDNQLHIEIDGVDNGSLLPSGITVPSLNIRRVLTGHSAGVRIEMTLEDRGGSFTRDQKYYSTVILRGSY